jgi:hypothetical protein
MAQETLPVLAEEARVVAAQELRHPSLYSILVDLAEASPLPRVARLRFGFQEILRGRILGTRLKTCWVDMPLDPRRAVMGFVGTFGRQQFRQLASLSGVEFPPPALDLRELRLETPDILRLLTERPWLETTGRLGTVQLSVFLHEGRLAWRALQEVDRVGLRTIFFDARNGNALFEKVDRDASAT